jgi:hypothetical protein
MKNDGLGSRGARGTPHQGVVPKRVSLKNTAKTPVSGLPTSAGFTAIINAGCLLNVGQKDKNLLRIWLAGSRWLPCCHTRRACCEVVAAEKIFY